MKQLLEKNMNNGPFDVAGSLDKVFNNPNDVYEGTLWHYLPGVLSAPNQRNGYHNTRHTLHMGWLAYDAGVFYRDHQMMSPREVRNQIIAHLEHDYGHSGKPISVVPDKENLKVAEAHLRATAALVDRPYLDDIAKIMWATHFPHRDIENPTLGQLIIQDSDLTQALHPAWFEIICVGLGLEWGKTPLEMLAAQEPFLRSLKNQTDWAKMRFPSASIEQKVTEVRNLLTGLQSVS